MHIHDEFTLSEYYGVAVPTFSPDHAAKHPRGAHEKLLCAVVGGGGGDFYIAIVHSTSVFLFRL